MPYTSSLRKGNWTALDIVAWRFARWLVPLIYVVAALAFIADLYRDNSLAYGIIYVPLIATGVFYKKRNGLWILSAITCLMVVIGAFFPAVNPDMPDMIGNRILSILAILATTAFVYHARNIQDRLAAETRRAEAAERIKTEIIGDLSEELHTPLLTLLSLLNLMMADCRPDQREALGLVRGGGQRLLATIDNLIDLTQFEARELRFASFDLAAILRDAAESASVVAAERQVAVVAAFESGHVKAIGDSWAVRRILDNLLSNAVRFTPPGGVVSVAAALDQTAGVATALVSDTGSGFPPELTYEPRAGAFGGDGRSYPGSGGTGLVLSDRLARAMNGRLTLANPLGSGAKISLTLPAAPRTAADGGLA